MTLRYGEVVALDAIDLVAPQGSFTVLLGPSGCGKSTVLRAIAGLERPASGDVIVEGRRVNDLEPQARDVAMVFQNYALYPHMTVRENIAFPLRMRRVPRADIRRRVEEAARLLAIEPLLDRKPRHLSGGQRQRVAIGRAIVRDARIFLFDEPLSNLDARLRGEMRREIARLHRRLGKAVVYVTHDQVEALTLGEKIVVLRGGRIEQTGTPEDVYLRPATPFVATFLGAPPMNILEGRIESGRFLGSGVELPVEVPDCPRVELGFRPDRSRLGGEDGRGRVELVENLGSDRYVHVDLGGPTIVVRLAPGESPRIGETVPFSVDRDVIHLFGDGRRI
ncbi:MAG: ATP-binding cassette domain-containing protein [Planctomycetes bacterium]|nr:ATP-binding cassette domain-containing protein [Planctomycetota bacterium]